jgi:hypothetical protein
MAAFVEQMQVQLSDDHGQRIRPWRGQRSGYRRRPCASAS